MKEEYEILRKCGNENPFTVPEGYFDNFTQNFMDKLPEKEAPEDLYKKATTWQKLRPWFYMAAMFAGILLSFRYVMNITTGNDAYTVAATTESDIQSDEYIEAIMDHSMMDDYTLYQYLTEADMDGTYNKNE